jgi:hypothetical protein
LLLVVADGLLLHGPEGKATSTGTSQRDRDRNRTRKDDFLRLLWGPMDDQLLGLPGRRPGRSLPGVELCGTLGTLGADRTGPPVVVERPAVGASALGHYHDTVAERREERERIICICC